MERDPLRSISQTGVFVLFYLLVITVMAMPLYWVGGQLVETTVTPFIGSLAATFLCWKIYDEAPLPHMGLALNARGGRDLWMGSAAGMMGAALAVLPGVACHLAHFTPVTGASGGFDTASFVILLIFCGAAGEEMLFHGFAFQSLMNGLGPFAAIFPVGVVFGLLHMGNPDATWLSTAQHRGLRYRVRLRAVSDPWIVAAHRDAFWMEYRTAVFGNQDQRHYNESNGLRDDLECGAPVERRSLWPGRRSVDHRVCCC